MGSWIYLKVAILHFLRIMTADASIDGKNNSEPAEPAREVVVQSSDVRSLGVALAKVYGERAKEGVSAWAHPGGPKVYGWAISRQSEQCY